MDKNFILKACLIAVISFFIVILQMKDNKKKMFSSVNSGEDKIMKSINQDLKTVYKINEVKKQKAQLELDKSRVDLSDENPGQLHEDEEMKKYGVEFRTKDQFEEIYQDFENKDGNEKMDLDDMVSKRVKDRKWATEYQRGKNEAYIKEFIENARANGFEIIVDTDNEVKSVRRIRPKGYSEPY
ncbi:hypothetical protein N9W41_00040 [bacterium]|nr:hypothetical protein [bacterium]